MSSGLDTAIIIVIAFFALVLLVIVSVFLVCWYRRTHGKGKPVSGFAFWSKKSHLNGDVVSTKSNAGEFCLAQVRGTFWCVRGVAQ